MALMPKCVSLGPMYNRSSVDAQQQLSCVNRIFVFRASPPGCRFACFHTAAAPLLRFHSWMKVSWSKQNRRAMPTTICRLVSPSIPCRLPSVVFVTSTFLLFCAVPTRC